MNNSLTIDFHSHLSHGRLLTEEEIQTYPEDEQKRFKDEYDKYYLFNYLDEILQDDSLEEIYFHHPQFIQARNKDHLVEVKVSIPDEIYQQTLQHLALTYQVEWNYSDPFKSFKCIIRGKEFRASLLHYSTSSSKYSKMILRRTPSKNWKPEDFNLNAELINLLKNLIKNKKNILISGATGSGKTSFLKYLLTLIPENKEHIILIEDTHEIITNKKNYTHMIANEREGFSMNDYLTYSLRLRPERIILGEIRSHEVVPLINALNTGHGGLLATVHANSALDSLNRCATLFQLYSRATLEFELTAKLISTSIDNIIYLKDKRVIEMIEVLGQENGNFFYESIFPNNAQCI